MKSIILAAALAAAPIPALAEAWKLFEYKHWAVYMAENSRGTLGCTALNTATGDYNQLMSFGITINDFGLSGNLIDRAIDYGPSDSGYMHVWIDRREKWIVPSRAFDDHVTFRIPQTDIAAQFINEIYHGQRVYIDPEGDGQWNYWFSLQGSAAALNELAECGDRISWR